MYTEYCSYNKVINDYEVEKKLVFKAMDNGVNGIAIPIHMIREMKEYMPEGIVISAPIDYPSGYSSSKVRNHMVISAIKAGANAIDYVPNHYLMKNKFTELLEEITSIQNICKDNNVNLRVFLEYNHSDNIVTTAKILVSMGITHVFPTLGYHHDDFNDNIINCNLLHQYSDVLCIFNGYLWKKEQLKAVEDAGIFGVRLYNSELILV